MAITCPTLHYKAVSLLKRNVDQFPQKLNEIAHYFKNTVPEGSVVKGLQTTPKVMEPAELWLLGSSNDSAKLDAEQGLPYVFAHFINFFCQTTQG